MPHATTSFPSESRTNTPGRPEGQPHRVEQDNPAHDGDHHIHPPAARPDPRGSGPPRLPAGRPHDTPRRIPGPFDHHGRRDLLGGLRLRLVDARMVVQPGRARRPAPLPARGRQVPSFRACQPCSRSPRASDSDRAWQAFGRLDRPGGSGAAGGNPGDHARCRHDEPAGNRLAESDAELARGEFVSAEELAEAMRQRRAQLAVTQKKRMSSGQPLQSAARWGRPFRKPSRRTPTNSSPALS